LSKTPEQKLVLSYINRLNTIRKPRFSVSNYYLLLLIENVIIYVTNRQPKLLRIDEFLTYQSYNSR